MARTRAQPVTSPSKPAARTRSRVSNGAALFVEADARSAWGRRYRDILSAHVSDLGGADVLSEAQAQLCRRAAALALECERMEGAMAEGQPPDFDLYNRLVGGLGRVYERLGIKRIAREISNPIVDHFARPVERVA